MFFFFCCLNFLYFEGYGITSDGKIIFVNASTCDINYYPHNPPIVFDITLPKGKTKADFL